MLEGVELNLQEDFRRNGKIEVFRKFFIEGRITYKVLEEEFGEEDAKRIRNDGISLSAKEGIQQSKSEERIKVFRELFSKKVITYEVLEEEFGEEMAEKIREEGVQQSIQEGILQGRQKEKMEVFRELFVKKIITYEVLEEKVGKEMAEEIKEGEIQQSIREKIQQGRMEASQKLLSELFSDDDISYETLVKRAGAEEAEKIRQKVEETRKNVEKALKKKQSSCNSGKITTTDEFLEKIDLDILLRDKAIQEGRMIAFCELFLKKVITYEVLEEKTGKEMAESLMEGLAERKATARTESQAEGQREAMQSLFIQGAITYKVLREMLGEEEAKAIKAIRDKTEGALEEEKEN